MFPHKEMGAVGPGKMLAVFEGNPGFGIHLGRSPRNIGKKYPTLLDLTLFS
jgi:hypothetical protein